VSPTMLNIHPDPLEPGDYSAAPPTRTSRRSTGMRVLRLKSTKTRIARGRRIGRVGSTTCAPAISSDCKSLRQAHVVRDIGFEGTSNPDVRGGRACVGIASLAPLLRPRWIGPLKTKAEPPRALGRSRARFRRGLARSNPVVCRTPVMLRPDVRAPSRGPSPPISTVAMTIGMSSRLASPATSESARHDHEGCHRSSPSQAFGSASLDARDSRPYLHVAGVQKARSARRLRNMTEDRQNCFSCESGTLARRFERNFRVCSASAWGNDPLGCQEGAPFHRAGSMQVSMLRAQWVALIVIRDRAIVSIRMNGRDD
jgi:hypothetical protein